MPPAAAKILAALHRLYPKASGELRFRTPLQALVAAILAAQCTDARVNQVTATLFRKYRKAEDYARAPLSEFQGDIRSVNFYRNKARSIQACCRLLLERHGGRVPKTLDEMIRLPGVGRKTANMVLGNCYGVPGIIVDTHVIRVAFRLGLTREKNPEKIETDLMRIVPERRWTLFSHQLSRHGREVCKARAPLCPQCALNRLCPKAGVVRP